MGGEIIFTYEQTQKQMVEIIKASESYCFLFAFYFDWNYDKDIQREIIQALERGVSIYINLSERSENNIDHKHPQLHVRQSDLDKQYDDRLFKIWANIWTGDNEIFKRVCHTRFIYNGNAFMLGGTNVNHRYNGTTIYRNRERISDDIFFWYDTGYLTYDYPNQYDFFRQVYIGNDTNINIRKLNLNDTLIISNETHHEYLIKHIRHSRRSIYIECQYFHSVSGYMSNQISIELAKRVNRAIKGNESFTVILVTNSLNHDERSLKYMTTGLSYLCLVNLRNTVDCDDETFNRYVICKMPTIDSHIIIHNKLWIFDDSNALYTTGNILDRSYYDTGDFEMGIIINDGITELVDSISKIQQTIPFTRFDFTYPYLERGFFFIDNLILFKISHNISDACLSPLLNLLETDLNEISGLKYKPA